MNHGLISFIIPTHNSGHLLGRCIESINQQTYKNIEIIIVDDGSTDDTWSLIKQICNKYKNLTIVPHQEPLNRGVSAARNKGIDLSNGSYISFIDSDDIISPNYCSSMIKHMGDSEIVIGGRITYVNENPFRTDVSPSLIIQPALEVVKDILTKSYNAHMICTKMFKASLIKDNNLSFINHYIYEDLDFSVKTALCATTCTYIDTVVHYYYVRENSISSSINDKHIEDFIYIIDQVRQQLNSFNVLHLCKSELKIFIWRALFRINRLYAKSKDITYEAFTKCTLYLMDTIEELSLGDDLSSLSVDSKKPKGWGRPNENAQVK